jgi:FAD/FMN-containing dehydrogenase
MSLDLATLRRDFGGDIVEPGTASYDAASRTVLAAGHPVYVLRPKSVRDVQTGVKFAADAGMVLSVRGGGHGFPGFGTNEGGVVIDLGDLDDVEVVDTERHVVRIGGGATWGQVVAALSPYGLAISSGDTKTVGVGGLTLGGGVGWKVRKYGLALDSLVGAQVVTAAGEVVRADAASNPSLFWALRGGGGNFGIVTAFEFAAQPTTQVFHGKISFPATSAAGVLQGWADYLRGAPDGITSIVAFGNPFAGGASAPVEVHLAVDSDDPATAAAAIDPIRRLGSVLADDVTLKPYAAVLEEGMVPPPGIKVVSRSTFVETGSVSAVLRVLTETAATGHVPFTAIRSLGGAVSRVAPDATAYSHRDAELMLVTTSVGPEPVLEAGRPALDAYWGRLAPHITGAYANFLSAGDVSEIYPPSTYDRLASVKREYDPLNLFAGNFNVRPQ